MPSKQKYCPLLLLTVFFLSSNFLSFAQQPAQTSDNTPMSFTINSTSGIQIAPKESKSWHQDGFWPILTATLPNAITSVVAIIIVYIQASRSFKSIVKQKKIDLLSSSLNEFYNPLLALMDVNAEIFDKIGPSSFPETHVERSAAALVWKEAKLKILENNEQIENILRTKSHLMNESDSMQNYKNLLLHVAMYEVFQKIETDGYAKFQFPKEMRSHIALKRSESLKSFNCLVKE